MQIKGTDGVGGGKKNSSKPINNTKKKKEKEEKKTSVVKPSQRDELTALIEEDKAVAKAENKIFGGSSGTFTVEDEDTEKRTKTRQNLTALADVLTGGTLGEVSRGTRAPAGDTSVKKIGTKKEPLMTPETGSKATSITARPVTDEKTRKKQEADRKTGRAVFNAGDLLRDAAEATVNYGKNDSTHNYLTYDENGRIDTTKTTPAQMRAAALAGDANVAQQQQWTAQRRAEDLIRNPYKHTQDEYGAAFEDVRKATEEYQKREGAYLDYVQPNRGPDVSAQTRAQERKIAERAPDVDDEKLWRLRADRETDEGRKAEYTARADAEKDVKASTKRIREAQDAVDRMLGDGNFYSEEAWTRAMDVLSEIDKGTYDLAGVYGAQEGIDEAKRAQIDKVYSDLRKRNQSLYEQADARRENASLWSDGGKTVKRALGESNRSNNVYGGLNSFASALNDAQLRNLAGNDVAYQEGLKAREVAKTGDIEKIDSYIKDLEDRLTGIGRMSDEEAFEYDTRFPQQDNAPGVGGLLSAATRYKKQITDADILESGGIQFALGILDNEKWAIRQEKLNKLTQKQIDLIDAYNNDRHGERGNVFYTPSATMQIESMSRQSKESDALSAMNDDIKKRTGLDWWEAAKLKREVDEHTTAQDFRRDAEILAGSDLTKKEISEGKKAVQSPLLAGILSIGANAIGGISSAVGMLDAAFDPDTEFSQDSPFAALQQFGSTVRGAQSTQIKNDISGFLQGKEFTKGFSDFMGGAAALGYSAAMSAVDSFIARKLGGNTEILGKMTATDALFGINAFTDKYAEAKANHSPTANAMITALGAGVFEALFEHLSLEQMKVFGQVTPKTGMDYVWNAVKAFTTEGSEELSTDLANTVWDIFVNGANSDHYRNVALYRLRGLSEKDAKRKAGWDLFWQYLESFAAGGLAGAGESSLQTASGGAWYAWRNKTAYANYIDTGSFFSSKRGNADVKAALKAPNALKYEGANQEAVRDTGAQMWNRILNAAEAASEMGLKSNEISALLNDSERIKKGEDPQTDLKKARKYAIAINQAVARRADIEYKQHLKDAFKTILTEQGAKSPDMLLEALANEVRNRRTDADGNTEGGAVGPEAYLIKTKTAQRALAEYERAVELDRGGDETNAALPAWYTRMKSRDSLSDFRSGAALGLYRLGVKQIDRSRLNVGEPGYVKADGTFVSATPTGVSNTDGYGKTILHMSDGTQVDMNNVTFADGDTAVIYKAAGDLPITAAKGLVEKWQAARERGTTTPAEVFASGYSRFFSTGRAGIAFETAEEASRDIERAIGQDAAKMAHAQGENFRMNPAEMYVDMTADEAKVVTFGRGESATLYDADDPFYRDLSDGVNYAPDVDQNSLSLDQKAQVYLVSAGLNAKKGRTPVVVHDTIFSGDNVELNGFYDKENNVLHVSINAEGGLLLRTVAHEMAHQLKQTAPEAWNALRDYVVQTLKDTPMGKSTAYDEKMRQLEAAYTYTSNGTRYLISNKAREGTREYIDALEEEMVSDSCFDVLGNEENVKEFAKQNLTGLKKIARWISDFLGRIRDAIKEISYNDAAVAALRKQTDKLERIRELFEAAIRESEANRGAEATESGIEGGENVTVRSENESESEDAIKESRMASQDAEFNKKLEEAGMAYDEKTGIVYAPSFSRRYSTGDENLSNVDRKKLIDDLTRQFTTVGGMKPRYARERAEALVRTEELASLFVRDSVLDYVANPHEKALKPNSDYDQGTFDLNNNCTKRRAITHITNNIQNALPNDLMTADDYSDIRLRLMADNRVVACGMCFVEDRRKLLGEITRDFLKEWNAAIREGRTLTRHNAKGKAYDVLMGGSVTERYGFEGRVTPDASVKLQQADFTDSERWFKLQEEHPEIAAAYEAFNNARGQSAGRLLLDRAEYKREVLSFTQEQVDAINRMGGMRIFSFSDFETIHLVDLLQFIIDCASKGLMIQGYTKQADFAKLVRGTLMKLNRSLVPYGATGIRTVNGKEVLAIDTVEGMDINSSDFIDESDNPDVGNNITGINDKQILLAMRDEFIHYIIPFHTNKSKKLNVRLGVGGWKNYKTYQTDRQAASAENVRVAAAAFGRFLETSRSRTEAWNKAFAYAKRTTKDTFGSLKENKMVNIYTDVLTDESVVDPKSFVEKFLKICEERALIPRFPQFLNVDGDGNFAYNEGYEKLLLDFKLFDKDGNILPQRAVQADFDEGFIKELLEKEAAKSDKEREGRDYPQDLFDEMLNYIRAKHGYKDADAEAAAKTRDIIMETQEKSNRDEEGMPGAAISPTAKTQNVKTVKGGKYDLPSGLKLSRNYSAAQDRNALIEEYKKPVTREDVDRLHELFKERKSINNFTPDEIRAAGKWAYKYWQQMGTKSPFFRAWFGDWRAYDQTPVKVVECRNDLSFRSGSEYNEDMNARMSWSPDRLWESVTNSNKHFRDTMKTIASNIDGIVKNAVLLNTENSMPGSKSKMKDTALMHNLYAIVDVNGIRYLIKMYAEEALSAKGQDFVRAYTLKNIKIEAGDDPGINSKTEPLPDATPATITNIAELYAFVKQNDKDFVAGREVAPELLNEDRTPRVFYHGTGEKFTEFDITKSRSWEGSPDYDLPGFYFTADERAARDYGETGAYYLTADKVWRTTSDGDLYSLKKKYGSYRAAYDALVGQGYDMVIVDDGDSADNEYIVLKAENIKSATDNIGTYNRGEADIMFSRRISADASFWLREMSRENEYGWWNDEAKLNEVYDNARQARSAHTDIVMKRAAEAAYRATHYSNAYLTKQKQQEKEREADVMLAANKYWAEHGNLDGFESADEPVVKDMLDDWNLTRREYYDIFEEAKAAGVPEQFDELLKTVPMTDVQKKALRRDFRKGGAGEGIAWRPFTDSEIKRAREAAGKAKIRAAFDDKLLRSKLITGTGEKYERVFGENAYDGRIPRWSSIRLRAGSISVVDERGIIEKVPQNFDFIIDVENEQIYLNKGGHSVSEKHGQKWYYTKQQNSFMKGKGFMWTGAKWMMPLNENSLQKTFRLVYGENWKEKYDDLTALAVTEEQYRKALEREAAEKAELMAMMAEDPTGGIELSRKSDNKFLKTEIQESREKLDDAIDSMALGVKTNYEPAEKRVDREERRTLMLNYKSAASQGVRMAEEAVAEILKTDTALKEALREAQRQTKLSRDIGYRLTAASVKRAADALTEAHPEITATKVAFASALSGLYKLMMDDRSLPGDEALELASQVAKTATGDPWGETTLAQHELAQEILGKYIDIGYQQTFGDKADEKISALKDKARKGIANEREKSRLNLAEARAEYKKKLKEQHSTDRSKYEERLGEYKEHHKEMMHKRIEQHAKSKRIEQIRKHVAELRRKLTSPTEKKHIPANMLKTVIKALDMFRELDNTDAGDAVKWALADISDAYRESVDKWLAPPNEEILEIIDNFRNRLIRAEKESGKEKTIKTMTVDEIEGFWKIIRAVEKYVRESNQAHSEMLNKPISEMIDDLQHEISGKTVKPTRLNPDGKAARAKQTAKSLELRNLKPVYFFRRFASDTMEKLFWALQNSELGWERIAQEAQQAKWDADRAYDPNNKLWYERGTKPKTVTLELERGDKITLTALQAASLWLMAKDEGGATHLMQGGFIVDKPEYKKGSDGKYHPEVSDHNVRLTAEDFVTLGNALTEDQKAYAARLQKYLAGPLAAHGNAVTQKLYELDRFTNQTYWPLRSAQEFLDSDPNNPARADTVSVRSPGFTKARIPHASNPVVLEDMFTVWARHVNGMALYASMTLPLDDMLKVWNTRNYAGENIDAQSVKMEIERRFGKEYVRYMEQFLRDINGGLRGDPSASFINSMLSHFKAAAVMGNVSVALQQPASIGRAMAYIDPKYLAVGAAKALRRRGRSFDEMQEHAPIGGLKSRGAFDVMISTGLNESLIEREDVKGRTAREWANTVLGYGAEFGDAATWTVMWEACKAQVKTQEGLTGDALLNKAAELFNKTMVLTQVYDSVFSRSELMRAKDTGVKEATAFMAEPTTSLNMIEDMIFQLKNKRMSKGDAAKVFAGVMTSIILANAASALVGAVRKKDEEHSFWEKFLASFGSGVADDLTPISYIPVVKDIYSIFKGYGIDRSAYSGIATLYDTLTKVVNPDKRDPETLALLAGAMADLTGLPGTRLTKDVFAAARFAANLYNPDRPTFSAEGLWDAVKGEWTNPLTKTIEKQLEASRTAKLYRDYVNGSDDYEKRYEMYIDEGYTEDEIEKSLRTYYANQDKRTQQAKKLAEDGDISGYKALVEEMAADTGLSKSFIADAVLGYGKHVGDSIYTSSMVVSAFNAGSPDSAEILEAVVEARAQVYMAQGKDAETALKDSMSAMRTAFTSFFKTPYQDALKAGNTDEAERIRQIVVGSGVYADAEKAVANWAKEVTN